MIFWIFLFLNTILYGFYGYLGYQETFKQSSWFIITGLSLVLVGNLMWLVYLKSITNHTTIFINGMIWSSLLTAALIIVPFIFCNIKLSKVSMIGLLLCILGLVLLKSGDLIEYKLKEIKYDTSTGN